MTDQEEKKYSEVVNNKNISFLLFGRLCILGVTIFVTSYYTVVHRSSISMTSQEIFLILAILFGTTAISGLWLNNLKTKKAFIQVELLLYSVLISTIIYISGLANSPLVFLYLPLAMLAAILAKRRVALSIAAFSLLSYYVLIQNHINKWLVLPELSAVSAQPLNGLAIHFLSLISATALVCIATSFLRERLLKQIQRALSAEKKLLEMQQNKTELLSELEDGINKLQTAESELAIQNEMARLLAEKQPKDSSTAVPSSMNRKFIGKSKVMLEVFQTISKVATADSNILIVGESGTGKELVARSVHAESPRRKHNFVAVNCGAIPETLIESQLFGHKRGSFTGAHSDHKGYFEQAENGVIFLDEIGELPLHLQAKLLRAIQEKTIRPVGSEKDIPINVRIIAATNKDLEVEVSKKEFRQDLFYRLNVISIDLPPLRERKDDIPLLVNNFLKKMTEEEKQPVIPPDTMRYLMNYDYPGNIRELENIIERAIVLGGEIVLSEHLPECLTSNGQVAVSEKEVQETQIIENQDPNFPSEFSLDQHLKDIEKQYLEAALSETEGVKTKAADLLGMNFRSFRYRLQKFDIE